MNPSSLRLVALSLLLLAFAVTGCEEDPCPGDVGCACIRDEECFEGNRCNAGVCEAIVEEPRVGDAGGACYGNGTCNAGALCEDGTCVACEAGSDGCVCYGNATCDAGLSCDRGVCVDPARARQPPPSPKCYSPCSSSFTREDGSVAFCNADGLIEGCRGDTVCVEGSCVPAGQTIHPLLAIGDCGSDVDCPDFQTCIQGRCYSTCEANTDCQGEAYTMGEQCHRHVCRVPCDAASPCTLPGTTCQTTDGASGFCMPSERAEGAPVQPTGTFYLSKRQLGFTNVHIADRVFLTNEGQFGATFTVEKVEGYEVVSGEPLHWVELGCAAGCVPEDIGSQLAQSITVTVPGGATAEITVGSAANENVPQWTGRIEISSELGTRSVDLKYTSRPDGQWAGRMFYFANFPDENIDALPLDPSANDYTTKLDSLDNAFLRKWENFVRGELSLDELEAVVSSTQTESWRLPLMDEYCPDPNVACHPYDNANGYSVYSPDLESYKIPTGGAEMPLVVNLKAGDDPSVLTGRIVTAESLHYPGDPAVRLALATDPESCPMSPDGVSICRVTDLSADVLVGGRYVQGGDANCSSVEGYELERVPWLVPGFEQHTVFDPATGRRYRHECRDSRLPAGGQGATDAEKAKNRSRAAANPIPDGRTRVRRLRLIDGVIVDQTSLIVLFKEELDSFLGAGDEAGFAAYGIIRLRRSPAQLDDAAFVGNAVEEARALPEDLLGVGCSEALLDEVSALTGESYDVANPASAARLAQLVVSGQVPGSAPQPLGPGDAEEVHWWCEATNLIDGVDANGNVVPCPTGSRVRFFTLVMEPDPDRPDAPSPLAASTCGDSFAAEYILPSSAHSYRRCPENDPQCNCLENDACEVCDPETDGSHDRPCMPVVPDASFEAWDIQVLTRGTCLQEINGWASDDRDGNANRVAVRWDPVWTCAPVNGVVPGACTTVLDDEGRPVVDRRAGKVFYPAGEPSVAFPALRNEVALAFRYKTQFRSRTGATVGFSPQICVEGSDAVPYCYDPEAIEKILQRVDCAASLYTRHVGTPAFDAFLPGSSTTRVKDLLRDYLQLNFAYHEQRTNPHSPGQILPVPIVTEGFERLYTELLVNLGDDALTKAYASRFDLAGSSLTSFEGSLFEPDGFDVAGGAGFELYTLYQAVQYYQLALDRFYSLSPLLWESVTELGGTNEDGFIDEKTAVAWFERLIGASAQKARASSEIAARYRDFNQPELARLVVERAYTSTYLESIVLARMMKRLIDADVVGTAKAQITRSIEDAQLTYRSALLRMRDAYASITDNVSYFGYDPSYVPFPALGGDDPNAFELTLARARDKLAVAAEKEAAALEQNRSFETDAAAFQAELVDLRNSYENELAQLCGTFEADGAAYPAIRRYAHLSELGQTTGMDPCGLVGNGAIADAYRELNLAQLDLVDAEQALRDHRVRLEVIRQRVIDECQLIEDQAAYNLSVDQQQDAWGRAIHGLEQTLKTAGTYKDMGVAVAENLSCIVGTSTDCGSKQIAAAAVLGYYTTYMVLELSLGTAIHALQQEIDELETVRGYWNTVQECNFALVEANYETQLELLEEKHLEISALKAVEGVQLALSQIESLRNEAKRLQDQQEESQQLAIHIEAARNDPNVRIYKNDAVLTADRTFQRALKEAYRLTKIYEYYTSTAYAKAGDLFLVRLVSAGNISLESYVDELEDAFRDFEETYGRPDERVLMVSLKDDVLKIPRVAEGGLNESVSARNVTFRQAFFDPSRRDDSGYYVFSFPITLDQLSPATRNHKVRRVAVDVLGEDADHIFRVYLRQRGTGVVKGVDGEKDFYGFPAKSAVVNASFGNERGDLFADSAAYFNDRLRDRPLANTQWEVIVNLEDERDNLDLNATSLEDVRVFFYYEDFTGI